MGKRRKRGWHFYNSEAPRRRYGASGDTPRKLSRYHVFRWLLDNVASQNSGKYLSERLSRGDYHWCERDRDSRDQRYFYVTVKGNYIVVRQRRWLEDGCGVNTFWCGLTSVSHTDPILEENVILRHPLSQWRTFRATYAAAAPTLGVWLDCLSTEERLL